MINLIIIYGRIDYSSSFKRILKDNINKYDNTRMVVASKNDFSFYWYDVTRHRISITILFHPIHLQPCFCYHRTTSTWLCSIHFLVQTLSPASAFSLPYYSRLRSFCPIIFLSDALVSFFSYLYLLIYFHCINYAKSLWAFYKKIAFQPQLLVTHDNINESIK